MKSFDLKLKNLRFVKSFDLKAKIQRGHNLKRVSRTLTRKPRLECCLDCLTYADFDRQRYTLQGFLTHKKTQPPRTLP